MQDTRGLNLAKVTRPRANKAAGARPRAPRPKKSSRQTRSPAPPPIEPHLYIVAIHLVMLAIAEGEPLFCLVQNAAAQPAHLPRMHYSPVKHASFEAAIIAARLPGVSLHHNNLSQLESRAVPMPASPAAASATAAPPSKDKPATNVPATTEVTSSPRIELTYLALLAPEKARPQSTASRKRKARQPAFQSCYISLPWEDWRQGRPAIIETLIRPHLNAWARNVPQHGSRTAKARAVAQRQARVRILFAPDAAIWDEQRPMERLELLAQSGLITDDNPFEPQASLLSPDPRLGPTLAPGDRRRLALALGHLRRTVRARPDVRALLPAEFTLFELQRCVEIILGPSLHKQNFRRQVENEGLVEPTGRLKSDTGGRPAQLYRFRRDPLSQ